jgi:hypothetical protein
MMALPEILRCLDWSPVRCPPFRLKHLKHLKHLGLWVSGHARITIPRKPNQLAVNPWPTMHKRRNAKGSASMNHSRQIIPEK